MPLSPWIFTCDEPRPTWWELLTSSSCPPPLPQLWFIFYLFITLHSKGFLGFSSVQFSSVAQSCSTLCDPHESQHARPPCPSPTPGVHSNSSPSSRWCHPAISSSIVPFSSCPQSLPASESFPMSQLFAWGGQSTGVSTLASFLPKEHPGLISFRMDWLDLLAIQGLHVSPNSHLSTPGGLNGGSQFSSVSTSWEFIRNANSWAPPKSY